MSPSLLRPSPPPTSALWGLLRPLVNLCLAAGLTAGLAVTTPRTSFAQSATCEVCVPPDYAAACIAARDAAKANQRAADVARGAQAGSEAAHGRCLADLGTAYESVGRVRQENEARMSPWTVFAMGAGSGIAATILVLILAR